MKVKMILLGLPLLLCTHSAFSSFKDLNCNEQTLEEKLQRSLSQEQTETKSAYFNYVGLKFGTYNYAWHEPNGIKDVTRESNYYGVYFGGKFSPWFGVEVNLGLSGNMLTKGGAELYATTVGVTPVLYLPLSDHFNVFLRTGISATNLSLSGEKATNQQPIAINGSYFGFIPIVSAGIHFNFDRLSFKVAAEYTKGTLTERDLDIDFPEGESLAYVAGLYYNF